MAKRKTEQYSNESIVLLEGADRVRKRPAVTSAPTGWTAASTRFLRSFPIPSTRRARVTVI